MFRRRRIIAASTGAQSRNTLSLSPRAPAQLYPAHPRLKTLLPLIMGDPQFAKYPNLQLAQHIFQLTNPTCSKSAKQASLKSIQDAIQEHKMAPLYRYLAHPVDGVLNAPGEGTPQQPTSHRRPSSSAATMLATKNPTLEATLAWDEKLYESLKSENEKELEVIQKEEDEAAEKAGETEIQAARGKRAELYNRIGDKVSSERRLIESSNLTSGESDCELRGHLRKDRHSRHQDRPCPRHNTYRPLLWRQDTGQEDN